MSRISRYQESMKKYMKNKSCLTQLDTINKQIFYDIIEDCDYLIPIVLLTILSNQNRKNKTTLHGYYMGCGIELGIIMSKLEDGYRYHTLNRKSIINKIHSLINICLSQNIEHIQSSFDKEKVLNIYHFCIKYCNDKIYSIEEDVKFQNTQEFVRTDVTKFNFKNMDIIKNKMKTLKQVNINDMMTFINNKYGNICKIATVVGWLLGNGDIKILQDIEKIGNLLGILLKISYDFTNMEYDILNNHLDYSTNFVINFGIQAGFELFVNSKVQFIEGCAIYDMYSNTMKEVIDCIESRINTCIENTTIDLKSSFTL